MLAENSHCTLAATELGELIDENIIGRNAERNRLICRRVFLDGVPYERVAEEFGLSRTQIVRVLQAGFGVLEGKIRPFS